MQLQLVIYETYVTTIYSYLLNLTS